MDDGISSSFFFFRGEEFGAAQINRQGVRATPPWRGQPYCRLQVAGPRDFGQPIGTCSSFSWGLCSAYAITSYCLSFFCSKSQLMKKKYAPAASRLESFHGAFELLVLALCFVPYALCYVHIEG